MSKIEELESLFNKFVLHIRHGLATDPFFDLYCEDFEKIEKLIQELKNEQD